MWDFIQRNRTRLAFAGGIAIGGGLFYVIDRYALPRLGIPSLYHGQSSLASFFPQQAPVLDLHRREEYLFESSKETSDASILELCPKLSERILAECQVEALTEKLKSGQGNRVEIWNQIKVESITRLVSLTYGYSLLAVTIRVQMNILVSQIKKRLALQEEIISADSDHLFLQSFQYFMQSGIRGLIEAVRSKTEAVVSEVGLQEPIGRSRFYEILEQVFIGVDDFADSSMWIIPVEADIQSEGPFCNPQLLEKFKMLKQCLKSEACRALLRWCTERWSAAIWEFVQSAKGQELSSGNQLPCAKLLPVLSDCYFKVSNASDQQWCPLKGILASQPMEHLSKFVFNE